MPTYEYQCQKCGHEFEREQRIIEDPIKTCPACKAQKAKRLISNTSFVLKGGGWYKDLYSSTSAKKASTSDGESGSKSESSSDAKKESKKDAKSDSKGDSGSKKDTKGGSKSAA